MPFSTVRSSSSDAVKMSASLFAGPVVNQVATSANPTNAPLLPLVGSAQALGSFRGHGLREGQGQGQ